MNESVGQAATSIVQSNYVTGAINSAVGFWQSGAGSISSVLGIDAAWVAFFIALIIGFAAKEFFPSFGWMTLSIFIFALFFLLKLGVIR